DTSSGVALQRSFGSADCLLGMNWGYDGNNIWVSDGCSGEFVLGQPTAPATTPRAPTPEPVEMWGAVEPGKGFLLGRTEFGELSLSAYSLVRYVNQLPPIRLSLIISVSSIRSRPVTTFIRTGSWSFLKDGWAFPNSDIKSFSGR